MYILLMLDALNESSSVVAVGEEIKDLQNFAEEQVKKKITWTTFTNGDVEGKFKSKIEEQFLIRKVKYVQHFYWSGK